MEEREVLPPRLDRPEGARVRYDADRDVWLVHRAARTWPVPPRGGAHRIPLVPEVPDPDGSSSTTASVLPMLASLGIVAFAVVTRSVLFLVLAVVLVVAMVGGTAVATVSSRRRVRRRRARLREDFSRRLAAARAAARADGQVQRDALEGLYPDTDGVLRDVLVNGSLWERRPSDEDFAAVRVGRGPVPARCPIVRPDGGEGTGAPREADLEQLADVAVAESQVLLDAPVVLPLRSLSSVAVVGDPERARDLAGSWMASLAASCAPTELRILGWVPPDAAGAWEWCKWLPHTHDPLAGGGFGRAQRSVTTDAVAFTEALRELGRVRSAQRRRTAEATGLGGTSTKLLTGQHVCLFIDGYDPHDGVGRSEELNLLLSEGAELGVSVVLLVAEAPGVPTAVGARVDLLPEGSARFRQAGPAAAVVEGVEPDRVNRSAAERLARLMAPLQLAGTDSAADLVDTVRLVELLGYEDLAQHDARSDWLTEPDLTSPDLLATPVGVRTDGSVLTLDIKEAAASGMGPHGMLVGATGSGKSELLRSLVAGLSARHSPELVNALLIDFKGGAAFSELATLPHCAGLVTNLAEDVLLVDRVRASLAGELHRRQQLLRDAGNLDSIGDYRALRAGRPGLPPLPYLLVVVDEFGELLEVRPDFLDVLVAIGRLGRSLGVHLLLATQRLEEGRIRGLESHLRYRICLRTYSAAESVSVIGAPDAFALPPLPGLGYLRVDSDLVRFKAATVTTAYRPIRPHDKPLPVAVPFQLAEPTTTDNSRAAVGAAPVPAALQADHTGGATELKALTTRLAEQTSARARQVWLPPLPDVVPRRLVASAASRPVDDGAKAPPLVVHVGLLDDPARQRQEPLALDLSGGGGHVACVGGPRTGKTTFLRTLVEELVDGRAPADVSVYALDLGGGALHELQALPHVGAVAGRHDPEAVARLIRELAAILEERAAAFRAAGVRSMDELRRSPRADEVLPSVLAAEVFLLVDGVGVLRTEFPELDLQLTDLAAGSLQFGVHVVVTALRWLDIRPALLDALGTRLELHLNDSADSIVGRAAARTVPAERPGRGLTRDGRAVQLALPEGSVRGRRVHGPGAPRVLPLPARIREDQVPTLALQAGRPLEQQPGMLLAVSEFRLAPQYLDPCAPGGHLLVLGDQGSGKTTLLRRVARHVLGSAAAPEGARLHIVDLARGLLDLADADGVVDYAFTGSQAAQLASRLQKELVERLPPPHLSATQLLERSWWQGPEHFLVVDDYDLTLTGTDGPLGPLANAVDHARDIGLHVLLARRVAGSMRTSFEPLGQRMRELTPTALILDGDRTEGPVLGDRTAQRRPPGRGMLVRRGLPDTLVQLALPALDDERGHHPLVPAPSSGAADGPS